MDIELNFLEIPFSGGNSYIPINKISMMDFEEDENINGTIYRIVVRFDDGGIERFALRDENKWNEIRDKFLDYYTKMNLNV